MRKIKHFLFSDWAKYRHIGLLVFRIGLSYQFVVHHGWDKLIAGPDRWAKIGELGMTHLGVTIFFTFFGFLAAISESIGAICIGLGLFFRPAALLLMLTMVVGVNMHIMTGKGNSELALIYALSSGVLFFIGPGDYSLDKKLFQSSS